MSTTLTEPSSPETPGNTLHPAPQKHTMVYVAFGVVYFVWGSTFLAMRIGLESFPPFYLAGARYLLVGVILYPLMRWQTGIKPTVAHWKSAAITGCLLFSLGNGGVCAGEKTVPSGIAALLVATVSLWIVLVDWLRPGGIRPSMRVFGGLFLGFAGMTLLVAPWRSAASGRVDPVGAGILVLASLAWACGSLYSKHAEFPKSPLLGVSMQGLCGGILLWLEGTLGGEARGFHLAAISTRSWIALAYLFVFGSCLGFTAYMYVLKNSTATRAATYALVNPVVALFLGWLLAGEPISGRTLAAAAVILTAVIVVITAPHRDPKHIEECIPEPGEA